MNRALKGISPPCLLLLLAIGLFVAPARAAEVSIPRPPELERDVQFWIRVYSEISTSEGFLHDEHDLGVVYRKLRFRPDVTPTERREAVDAERRNIQVMLEHLAAGATNLTDDERAISRAFGGAATPALYHQAAEGVRFQLGQADRFREGLLRSGTWEAHIADTFANLGLPPELSALPHVESSFDPAAYSKVGATGLWQFMRGTGRRFLRIDDAVDERFDPFRSTEAAAQLLDYNYRLLGSWPLALTAYNHGAEGMRRARDTTGTTDIASILRNYQSRSFGFASRNFYVSFLAALEIDRHPEKYFGNITRNPEMHFNEVAVPAYVPLAALEQTLHVDRARLAELNPALRPPVFAGTRLVPKGYRLRLPPQPVEWTSELLASRLGPAVQYAGQPAARSYKVRKGDTLARIASSQHVDVEVLAQLNRVRVDSGLRTGRVLQLPGPPPVIVIATPAGQTYSDRKADEALTERMAESRVVAAAVASESESVTAGEDREQGPSLVPGGAVPQASDPVDYSVAGNGTVRVAAAETLGHYADWLGVSVANLRKLNNLQATATVPLGRAVKLDFSHIPSDQFERRRRAYHQTLQAEFFAGHRITGTEVYVTRRGDSLWAVTQRYSRVPAWLLQQYNPDIDFSALQAGFEIVVPKVEALPEV